MAFEVKTKVDQRLEFVLMARQEGANVRALCRRFGISPDTGYRLLTRYQDAGRAGLGDRSRRPHHGPRRTASAVEAAVVALRTTSEQGEAVFEAGVQRVDWKLIDPGGGQFDCQGQAVEAPADPRDDGSGRVVEPKARHDGFRSLGKQADRPRSGQALQRERIASVGQVQRRQRQDVLTGDA